MIDRTKYPFKYAPPASELTNRWTKQIPTGREIESFFLNELCESAAHDYFLVVSDLFYDVIAAQPEQEQFFSLRIIGFRLIEASEKATSADPELATHFHNTLQKFASLYYQVAEFGNPPINSHHEFIRISCLAVHAALAGDLPLAKIIYRPDETLRCANLDCSNNAEVFCEDCGKSINAYSHFESNA